MKKALSMRKALLLLFCLLLVFCLVGCGTDPNITAYKERLCESDWALMVMGTKGMIFRFNEDGTGQVTVPNMTGKAIDIEYEVTNATENGDSGTLTFYPLQDEEQETEAQQNSLPSSEEAKSVWETTFVPGGLQITNTNDGEPQILQPEPRT